MKGLIFILINFDNNDVKKCIDFAYKVHHKHGNFKDKNNTTKRSIDQTINDIIRGKLAEIAVYKYLKKHLNKNIKIPNVDFKLYPDYIADKYDFNLNNYNISIKSSKINSSCLLIEKERFVYDKYNNPIGMDGQTDNLPDIYIFVQVQYDKNKKSYAKIAGIISQKKFWNNKTLLNRGFLLNKNNAYEYMIRKNKSNLTNYGVPLLATNYGIHINQLFDISNLVIFLNKKINILN